MDLYKTSGSYNQGSKFKVTLPEYTFHGEGQGKNGKYLIGV